MASVFTAEDVQRYFELIQLPARFVSYPHKDFEFLRALHICQISTMPYENLSIHYSKSHQVNINPRAAFEKFAAGRGRGGYCMEVAIFYLHMLRAIGFTAYHTGVRIRARVDGVPQGEYIGLVHIVNIVTLDDGEKYAVDVAFGGDGPTAPMRLKENQVVTNLGTQEIRFVKEQIAEFETDEKFWIYQYRNSKDRSWNSFYCFLEVPFIFNDFSIMNYFTSTASHQVYTVLIVSFLRKGSEITGKVMLVNGTVKKNTGGKTEIIYEAKNEGERIMALQKYFGITLTEEEKAGVRGRSVELV